MRRRLFTFLAIYLMILPGCARGNAPLEIKEKSLELNIGYFSQKHFEDRYASLMALEYPNLQYSIVPTGDIEKGKTTLSDWFEEHQVDLIYLPAQQFQEAANLGLLQNLDLYVERDSFPVEALVPSVADLTRQYGNGELYGLAPTFYGSALVYNRQIFDQYGVAYPEDRMTWKEIVSLASQFPKGLTLPYRSAADWLIDIGRTEDLQAYNEQTDSITLNSPSWTSILESVQEPLKQGNIAFNDINKNSFIAEKYAMAVVGYDDFKVLEQQGSEIKWKLVTMPVNPLTPETDHHVSLAGVWAIPSHSPQTDAAWELIRFFVSDRVAEWEYRSVYGFSALASHTSLGQPDSSIEAFYKQQPLIKNSGVPEQVYLLLDETVEQILSGGKTVRQALADMPKSLSQAK
ncbi:extracellular solute-binding protein [Paenibacillus sp. M1]|uniref:Extracellular solute-binding protein n=1 Tax=Paenibacillus haidiansis TaxID=1574488 RepID=A0ABU7VZD7_9BACL